MSRNDASAAFKAELPPWRPHRPVKAPMVAATAAMLLQEAAAIGHLHAVAMPHVDSIGTSEASASSLVSLESTLRQQGEQWPSNDKNALVVGHRGPRKKLLVHKIF